jgi:hypothetical protein
VLRKLTIELDKVVIGSDLNAAEFAHENKAFFIRNRDPSIFVFDSFQDSASFAGVEYHSKIDYWDHLVWDLAMRGFCPFGDLVKNIRLDGDCLTIATKNERVVKVDFNECYVFDLTSTEQFPFEGQEETQQFRVFDWFWVKGMTRHKEKILFDRESSFVNTVHFFVEDKTTGIATESVVGAEEVQDFNKSATYARLKATHMIKKASLKSVYKTLKVDFFKREILPIKKTNYKRHKNLVFMGESL